MWSAFYSYRFFKRWALGARLETWFFQLSVGVKASLSESQQMSCFPSMVFSFCFHDPFTLISCCIHIPSCSFHFALFFFHLPLILLPYGIHVLSFSVLMYQIYKSPPKPLHIHNMLLSFLLPCCYRSEACCYRLPSSGLMNMYMYN